MVAMPSGQGWSVLRYIPGSPKNALSIHVCCHFIVGADDVEVSFAHTCQHVVDDLFR